MTQTNIMHRLANIGIHHAQALVGRWSGIMPSSGDR